VAQKNTTIYTADNYQMLNLKNFARLMDVCPNTVRNWMATGKLRADRHYLRCGRIIRFPWSDETMARLMTEWAREAPPRPKMTTLTANGSRLRFRLD